MSKTKTVRVKNDDAFILEQASRELAAELMEEVSVSMLIQELVNYVGQAKEDYKRKANKISLHKGS